MKPFESFLGPHLQQYLAYRQSMGGAKDLHRFHMRLFDRYLKEKGADWDTLKPPFFLQLRTDLNLEPRTVNRVLSALRCFFQFLVRQDVCEQNPVEDIPSLPENLFIPFVFSPEQVEQLLTACSRRIRKSEHYFLFDMARYVAMVLLARCGMRISEPLRLLCKHYRPEEGTL